MSIVGNIKAKVTMPINAFVSSMILKTLSNQRRLQSYMLEWILSQNSMFCLPLLGVDWSRSLVFVISIQKCLRYFNSMSLSIHVLSFNSSIKWFAMVWVNFMISSQNFKLIWFTICDVACFPINKQWKLGWKEAIILPSYTHFPLLTPFEPSKLLSFQVTFVKDYTYTKGKKWNKMVEVKEKIKVKWSEQKKKKKTSIVMKK